MTDFLIWLACCVPVWLLSYWLGTKAAEWLFRKRHVVSGFPANAYAHAKPLTGETFQFYPDNWPEGVPVESLGREHAP